jgi:hypothetical protein
MNVQETYNTEVRDLSAEEINAVCGGILPILLGIGLFELGVIGGTVAANISYGKPWYGSWD